jgi:hypothetical protein
MDTRQVLANLINVGAVQTLLLGVEKVAQSAPGVRRGLGGDGHSRLFFGFGLQSIHNGLLGWAAALPCFAIGRKNDRPGLGSGHLLRH